VSSGLAVTLTQVSWGRLGELVARCGPASDLIFVPQYMIVVGLRFKWYTMYLLLKNNVLFFTKCVLCDFAYRILDANLLLIQAHSCIANQQ
jgi:hypothetical protein